MIWVLLTGLLGILIWYNFIRPLSYWKAKGVKQTPNPWPILGDFWITLLRRMSFNELIKKVYNMYPNTRYMGYYQFTLPTLMLKDPELIKQITIKDFDHFTDHGGLLRVNENDPLMSGVLILLKGQRWREMRATLSGTFTSSKMKNMFHLIEETGENFVKFFLDKNENVIEMEMLDAYRRYTNDVIATAAYGIQCDSLRKPNNEFFLMGKKITNGNILNTAVRIIANSKLPKLCKLLNFNIMNQEVSKFFRGIINETIKIREETGLVRPDMINLLLEARKGIKHEEEEAIETGFATVKESAHIGKVKQIKNLTNDLITSQALIFFIAGFDTISRALSFGSYELAVNKDVQDRLRKEIKETYEKNNKKITYDELLKMKYLDMVVSEILRIWPPITLIDRVCTKPYTIEPVNSDEKPVHLKVGDVLLLPFHAIHRDPAYYPNPDKFDPERFSDENKSSINPYTYMPFGIGPRNCIGSRFALLEAKVLFFNLLLNFEILPCSKTQIPIKIQKKGIQLLSEGGFWFSLKRIDN